MRRFLCGLMLVGMACVAAGCGGPAAVIPENTAKYDSAKDKVDVIGGPGGGGVPVKGGSSARKN